MTDRMSVERLEQADRLRELAALQDDREERDRLLDAAAEAESFSLNGAGNGRPAA